MSRTAAVVLGLLLTAVLVPGVAVAEVPVAPPAIVPFAQWAPDDCPTPTGADPSTTQRVVVHHSHDPVAATPDQVVPTLAEICRIHVARGFDTIGYHYVVDPWGTVWQARGHLPGPDGAAPTTQPEGAHVQGGNPGATGVVFLGDHEATPPTEAAVTSAVHLMAWLVEATGQDPAALVGIETTGGGTSLHAGHSEVAVVAGHAATNATLCPGQHLRALLPAIRDAVRTTVTAGGAPGVGTLVVTDAIRPAPDASTQIASSGPILAAPPPVGPVGPDGGVEFAVTGALATALAARRREGRATASATHGLSRRGRSGSA